MSTINRRNFLKQGGALLAATFADDGGQPIPHLIASIDGVAVPAPAKRRAISVASIVATRNAPKLRLSG